MKLSKIQNKEIVYPEGDGKPMAETGIHALRTYEIMGTLAEFFHSHDVSIGVNMLMYYEEGNPKKCVSPDIFVLFGKGSHVRSTLLLWKEGKSPDVIFEITSKSTRHQDMSVKKSLYERLGVREYFLFDPTGEYLKPPLKGYRLGEQGYVVLMGEKLMSEVLGLRLQAKDGVLRFYHVQNNQMLLSPFEEPQARKAAEAQVVRMKEAKRKEGLARKRAEERVANEALARQKAEEHAANEALARQKAEEHAANEALARQKAEEELAKLRAEMKRLQQEKGM